MRKYEDGDTVTCYFVIQDHQDTSIVRAWSDIKDYAKYYYDFHHNKEYRLKKMESKLSDLTSILEENLNDEIGLYNLSTKGGKHGKSKYIMVPMTNTEFHFINEEIDSYMASRVNYGYINECFYYLKPKYQKALRQIFLEDIMKKVIHERVSKITQEIEIDELLVLFRSLPDQFG